MKEKKISDFFSGIGVKRLSAVEVDTTISNQHEFNGVSQFRSIFGDLKVSVSASFMYFSDSENRNIEESGQITWYDARANHPSRTEYRLYFTSNEVIENAKEGDILIIAQIAKSEDFIVIIAENNSSISNQLLWLFDFNKDEIFRFNIKLKDDFSKGGINFLRRSILEKIGIDSIDYESIDQEELISKFSDRFPSTKIFSNYAYESLLKESKLHIVEDPDEALIALLEREEALFRILEKYFVEQRLKSNFEDVDDFIKYSLSVHNRRKSRAGYAFENHLETIFINNKILYSRNKVTEDNSKPDFIFPGIKDYHDIEFDEERLTMLGVKTSCKDRWRQILSEADKIKNKHLITLESGISFPQISEMIKRCVTPVIPSQFHSAYDEKSKGFIITLKDFLSIVKEKQHGIK